MSTLRHSAAPAALVLALVGTLAFATPSFADDTQTPAAAPTTQTAQPAKHHHMKMQPPSPEEMKAHVEERIQKLHDKLSITSDQEEAWGKVADAMRSNEDQIASLITERHNNAESASAVDDLQSYQKIAQAHADGLKKVADAFSDLYSNMSDDQKKNADKVFGSFEGHGPKPAGKHHHHKGAAAPVQQ